MASFFTVMMSAVGLILDRIKPMRIRNGLVLAQLTTCTVLVVKAAGLLEAVRDAARQETRLDVAPVLDGRVPDRRRRSDARAAVAVPPELASCSRRPSLPHMVHAAALERSSP